MLAQTLSRFRFNGFIMNLYFHHYRAPGIERPRREVSYKLPTEIVPLRLDFGQRAAGMVSIVEEDR